MYWVPDEDHTPLGRIDLSLDALPHSLKMAARQESDVAGGTRERTA